MWHTKFKQSGRALGSLIVAAALIFGAAALFLNRQAVADQVAVWQYQPSPEIAALAERAGLSEQGKFYFYASRPQLLNAERFNGACPDYGEQGATLGCYKNGRIYIYNIQDDRLDGIREVTAAHEMLHAAYARLGADEKQALHRQLDTAYDRLDDAKLADRMKLYDQSEPGSRYVELHAIIGTEYADLPPELEAHYDEYFADRNQVVALHQSYEAQFTERQARAAEIAAELSALDGQIEAATAQYNRDVAALNADIRSFNARAVRVQSLEEQNALAAERDQLLARSDELAAERVQIDAMIARYNQLVDEYNAINTELSDLEKSRDSTLAPPPSI